MDTAFARFESARLFSLQELIYEGRHEPFANLEDLQNVITDKWHDVDDQTVRKAMHLAAVAKQNGGPIQHIFC